MSDYEKILGILNQNKDKSFVKRILNPSTYPTLDLGNGQVATHKMAWGEVDGKHVVFPTVLYNGKTLQDYGDSALDHVLRTGNYITFDTPEEADWFTRNYKSIWGRP